VKLYRILELNGKFFPEESEDGGTCWNKMPGLPYRYTLKEAIHYIDLRKQDEEKLGIIHKYP